MGTPQQYCQDLGITQGLRADRQQLFTRPFGGRPVANAHETYITEITPIQKGQCAGICPGCEMDISGAHGMKHRDWPIMAACEANASSWASPAVSLPIRALNWF